MSVQPIPSTPPSPASPVPWFPQYQTTLPITPEISVSPQPSPTTAPQLINPVPQRAMPYQSILQDAIPYDPIPPNVIKPQDKRGLIVPRPHEIIYPNMNRK